jgi:hypothetical protein
VVTLAKLPAQFVADVRNGYGLPRPATRRSGPFQPAPADLRVEFRRNMTRAGVAGHDSGQEKLVCPWHADTRASLHVDWDAAVFNCFGCDIKGGWKRLRELVGEPETGRHSTVSTRDNRHKPMSASGKVSNAIGNFDTDREHERLCEALENAGVDTGLTRVADCRNKFSNWECPSDGRRKVKASNCNFRLDPKCLPSRLRKDFRRHRANLPDRVSLYVWKPENVKPHDTVWQFSRREVSDAFKRFRREQGLTAGFYGVRAELRNGVAQYDVLLVLPVNSKLLDITAVAENADINDAIEWYTGMVLEGITSWQTPEEMQDLLAEMKGARHFQGFGSFYERSEKAEAETLVAREPKKLGRVSGGSGKGGAKPEPPRCDYCGQPMRYMGKSRNADEANAFLQGAPLSTSNKCSEPSG